MLPTVKWYNGQPLIPETLTLMQDSGDISLFNFINYTSGNCSGVVSIQVDKGSLEFDLFNVTHLIYICPNGKIYSTEANTFCRKFDLSEISKPKLPIYINFGISNSKAYIYKEKEICTNYYEVYFTAEHDISAEFSWKLCYLERNIDDNWVISKDYIPPSLNLVHDLNCNITNRILFLCDTIAQYYDSIVTESDTILSRQVEFRNSLYESYKLKRILCSRSTKCPVHPYSVYSILADIYIRLSIYYSDKPEILTNYRHNNIISSLDTYINKILEMLSGTKAKIDHIKLEKTDNLMIAGNIPYKFLENSKSFFIVQLEDKRQEFNINDIKLAGSSRFDDIDKLALPGIKTEPLKNLPFNNALAGYCLFYKFVPGKEFDYLVRDKSLVTNYLDKYKNVKYYLCSYTFEK